LVLRKGNLRIFSILALVGELKQGKKGWKFKHGACVFEQAP
jgi:hypothetical protein